MNNFINVSTMADVPSREFHIRTTMTVPYNRDLGEVINLQREIAARQIAKNIVQHPKEFVSIKEDRGLLEIKGDVVILTTDEFFALMQDQFRKGVGHAVSMTPMLGRPS